MRALLNLNRKRAGMPAVDRIQDGGRAIAIEEGLTAYVFTMAAQHSTASSLTTRMSPPSVLKTCTKMTAHLEVSARSTADWHAAILADYSLPEHRRQPRRRAHRRPPATLPKL